ncbi:MAG: DUF4342 domain-containing protein [Bacillota bacterium]|jgi:hypothetical protein
MNDLEKIDAVRERTGVSYRRAREALERTDGDVIEALIYLEDGSAEHSWAEQIQVKGNDLIQSVRSLIREGNVRRIIIRQDGRTLVEFPVTVGAIGALLMPSLAALGAVAALVSECTILVQRRGPEDDSESEKKDAEEKGE